jgi:hypothetical protein
MVGLACILIDWFCLKNKQLGKTIGGVNVETQPIINEQTTSTHQCKNIAIH